MRLDAPTASAAFEVTNYEDEVYTYGITFEFLTLATEESQVAATVQRTIPSVRPGQTVKATVVAPEGVAPIPCRRSGLLTSLRFPRTRLPLRLGLRGRVAPPPGPIFTAEKAQAVLADAK